MRVLEKSALHYVGAWRHLGALLINLLVFMLMEPFTRYFNAHWPLSGVNHNESTCKEFFLPRAPA